MKPLCSDRPLYLLLSIILLHPLAPSASAQPPNPTGYRRHALIHPGDATRGRELFNDPRLTCANCHSVDGSASKSGPDLVSAGDAFGRQDLIEAVLNPSATIAPGYGTVIVETKNGEVFAGTLKQKTETSLELMGADGRLISIAATNVKEQSGTPLSLMPQGLHSNVSIPEFNDLIEYLTTLKQPESSLSSSHGMPMELPLLAKPATVRPFFTNQFKLPRAEAETGLSGFRQLPGDPRVFFVLHQKGMIWRVEKTDGAEGSGDDGGGEASIFADLTSEVFSGRGPNGLLDMAFHPDLRENRKYYLFYQIFEEGAVVTRIVEKEFDADFKNDSGNPPRELMKIVSVAEDHSGGCLQFGRDGFLYVVMGDTGPHNDPNGHAQNPAILLGKVMRIDVNRTDAGSAYGIPDDNPFRDRAGWRPEIWAYGFRNPWRFSFDRLTGDLWLADVGQDRVEEVAIVRRGENHGWNVYEGFEPFSNQFRRKGETYTPPVFAYRRKYGNSITGGHVYRGDEKSSFYGVYICGDYTSKHLFGITMKNGILETARRIGSVPQRIVSFTEDEQGNLYAVGYEGGIYVIDFTNARFE